MKVKIFDENHELDLEDAINDFLDNNDIDLLDIKYETCFCINGEEQLYSFSAMIIYNSK